jgi:transcriptional regulator with XRE-family HTH domain
MNKQLLFEKSIMTHSFCYFADQPGKQGLTIDQIAAARSQSPRRRGRPKTETPNPIDVRVGARLRLRRNMLGLSQEKLGEAIGLTFQQVQKYERGANRIGASRLHELSRVLDVPVTFFFDDTDPVRAPAMGGFAEPTVETVETDPLRKPETNELVRAYFSIEDGAVRRRLLDLTKALAT